MSSMKQRDTTAEDHLMNRDIFAGQWKPMRGNITDEDFERIAGQKDTLIGLLQEKYGSARAGPARG